MDSLVAFIETSHVECHLYKSSATTTTIFTTVNLQTDVTKFKETIQIFN